MQTNDTDSGLGEALASYQPTSMPAATWARFRDDAVALASRLGLDESSARRALSRLALFLADLADARPEATLDELLTPDQVAGYLKRVRADGIAAQTLQNRQGTLNRLPRLRAGKAPARARQPERHLSPYPMGELHRALAGAADNGCSAAVDFARSLLAGMTGARLPRRRGPSMVRVGVDGRIVTVDANVWVAPESLALPTSGTLDAAAVERGRAWAGEALGFRLDLRRLALTELTEAVRVRPAVDVLRRDGVGRDRLTAAVTAIGDVPQDQLRRCLRQSRSSEGSHTGDADA